VDEMDDDELLEALGVSVETKTTGGRTPRQERVIAGFEDILNFVKEHGRPPVHGEDRDIFERLYAVRLDRLRAEPEFQDLLAPFDNVGLLLSEFAARPAAPEPADDDALLAELGVAADDTEGLSALKHVKPRAEVRAAAEEIASGTVCKDFGQFKPLFIQVQKDLEKGLRKTRRFQTIAEIKQGEFFVVGGQKAYIAEVGKEFRIDYNQRDSRLRVIFNNGTESDVLLRSLQRALHKDEAGRRITEPDAGLLFESVSDLEGTENGTIYVLRNLSDHPDIVAHRDVIHKIGVTGGDVESRIANARLDATFLLADVEVAAIYSLFNITRSRLENLLHRLFAPARLDLTIEDRFGNPVKPREWFLVPLSAIDEVVQRIQDQSVVQFEYDRATASLTKAARSNWLPRERPRHSWPRR
jgi:T5orf172 domain